MSQSNTTLPLTKLHIAPPLSQKNFSYKLLKNVLLQMNGDGKQAVDKKNVLNQVDLITSMQAIGHEYVKYNEDARSVTWRHPQHVNDADYEIRYHFDGKNCHISYGSKAAADILVAPDGRQGAQVISMHNNHFHLNGAKRSDVSLQEAKTTCGKPSGVSLNALHPHKHHQGAAR